jgi:pimeloyl-ACP methyl ester carboxylesterase
MQDLVLVPGLVCTRALWSGQIKGLEQHAHITVADHTRQDTVQSIAASILAVAPPSFALAGLSLGGYIAFEIMRQAPERVTRLALLDTSAKPFDPAQRDYRLALVAQARREGLSPIAERLLPVFIHPDRLDDVAFVSAVRRMVVSTPPDVFARQQNAIMTRPDSRPTLSQIRVPTLALVGRDDKLTPVADHEEIAAGIKGCDLVVIEHCGHLATMERPEAVTSAMADWLAR